MCKEDIRIGRRSYIRLTNYTTVGGVSQTVLKPDPNRVGVMFGSPSSGTVWVNPDVTASIGAGFPLASGQFPKPWRVEEIGQAVYGSWSVYHTGIANGSVMEIILTEE